MTNQHNEYLPFTEDEADFSDYVRQTIERLLRLAFDLNMIDEITFRRLSIAVMDNSTNDYFLAILEEFISSGEEHLLNRIIAGAEFIDGLSRDDPRIERAEQKFEMLNDHFRELKERDEEIAKNYVDHPPDRQVIRERRKPA